MKHCNILYAIVISTVTIFCPAWGMDEPESMEWMTQSAFHPTGTSQPPKKVVQQKTTASISSLITNANESIKSNNSLDALENLKTSLIEDPNKLINSIYFKISDPILNYESYPSPEQQVTKENVQDLKKAIYNSYFTKNPGNLCQELQTTIFPAINLNNDMQPYYIQDAQSLLEILANSGANKKIADYLAKELTKLSTLSSKKPNAINYITSEIYYILRVLCKENITTIIQEINQQKQLNSLSKIKILTTLHALTKPSPTNQKEFARWLNNKYKIEEEIDNQKKAIEKQKVLKKLKNLKTKLALEGEYSIDELREYQETLEQYIVNLQKPKTPTEIAQKAKAEATLKNISAKIAAKKVSSIREQQGIIQQLLQQETAQAKKLEQQRTELTYEKTQISQEIAKLQEQTVAEQNRPFLQQRLDALQDALITDLKTPKPKDLFYINHFKTISKNISELKKLQIQYPDDVLTTALLTQYTNKLETDGKQYIDTAIPTLPTNVLLQTIDKYFPENDDILKPYSEIVTKKLIAKISAQTILDEWLSDKPFEYNLETTFENIKQLIADMELLSERMELFSEKDISQIENVINKINLKLTIVKTCDMLQHQEDMDTMGIMGSIIKISKNLNNLQENDLYFIQGCIGKSTRLMGFLIDNFETFSTRLQLSENQKNTFIEACETIRKRIPDFPVPITISQAPIPVHEQPQVPIQPVGQPIPLTTTQDQVPTPVVPAGQVATPAAPPQAQRQQEPVEIDQLPVAPEQQQTPPTIFGRITAVFTYVWQGITNFFGTIASWFGWGAGS
ncbi:MAG TPA: hypothetical protein VJJ26_01780 [Candidatus Babeliales bacterium]|nr:hypothetical protein [Candidatus Babeliales bacterium]